jgi:hypothetical protein
MGSGPLLKGFSLATAGRLVQGVGYASYGIAAVAAIGIASGGSKVARVRPATEAVMIAILLAMALFCAVMLLRLAPRMVVLGKRMVARSRALGAWERVERAEEPLVLYLRPFTADDETSTPVAYTLAGIGLPRLSTEEEHLARAVGEVGCFIGLSRPNQLLPYPGALRLGSRSHWRLNVTTLMRRARLVLVRIGDSRGVWWEVSRALRTVPPERLVFLLSGDAALLAAFRQRLEKTGIVVPEYETGDTADGRISSILLFASDGTPRWSPLPDARFRASRFQPLRPRLRLAFRPVFEQLNVAWTPPPVPLQAVVPALFLAYFGALCGYWFIVLDPWRSLRLWENQNPIEWIVSGFSLLLALGVLMSAAGLSVRIRALHGAITQFRKR